MLRHWSRSALVWPAWLVLLTGAGCGGVTGSPFRDLAVSCDGGPGSCGGGGCTSELQCNVANPRCDKNSGQCVPCLPQNDNCPIGSHCVAQSGSFACAAACRTSADCPRSDGGGSRECCNAACLDTMGDRANCGGCGKACPPLPNSAGACLGGVCALGSCNPGFADCNQMASDGCELTAASDVANCGGCGLACPSPANATASCTNGVCAVGACKFGFADCDKDPKTGCEADLLSVTSCGACGVTCPMPPHASPACKGGACTVGACDALFGDCNGLAGDGCETSLAADIRSCGACGRVCAVPNGVPACLNGVCGMLGCNPGFADCNNNPADGCEVNIGNDAKNCGGCGKVCGAQLPACANGVCGGGCAGGVGGAITMVMPAPLYGYCWYLGKPGVSCDAVCGAVGGAVNQSLAAANGFADDCFGGAVGQPATWFHQNGNKCNWIGPGNGFPSFHDSVGLGTAGSTYFGKCLIGGLTSGAFPGAANSDANRCLVCACSR